MKHFPHLGLAMTLALVLGGGCSGSSTNDVGPTEDAPASTDGDGDGVPRAMDCDDADPMVAATASRSCSNMCGSGTESCTNGTWSACSAPTDCMCATEGEMRVGTCGMCGMQSQRCTGGVWTGVSSCLGEGVCVPASVESRATMFCGTQERLCGESCTWGAWLQATPDGECIPTRTRTCPDNPSRDQSCLEDCMWGGPCF